MTVKKVRTDAEKRYFARQDAWVKSFVNDIYHRTGVPRTDTNTALFTRSLAKILATPFDRRYPKLNMLEILPSVPAIEMGAASVISRGHQIHGVAELGGGYGNNIPTVTLDGHESEQIMHPVLAKFPIFYQDLEHAAFSGVDLSTKLAAAAYRVVAEAIDNGLAYGAASGGTTGMINNVNISGAGPGFARVIQGGTTVGTTGSWALAATTNANIVDDFRFAINVVEASTIFKVDRVVVAPDEWARLIAPDSNLGYQPNLKTVLEASFGITIMQSLRLDSVPATLTPAGTAQNRAIFFESNPEIFNPLVSMGPEQYPPKVGDTGYEVTVHQRCGGVESMSPLGAVYFDMA